MGQIEAIPLSEVLRSVPRPKYILGTTYSLSLAFFEANVFPLFTRSNLEACLIICDELGYQQALTECPALMGAGQDYMVARAPIAGCFHPKVWLVLGDDSAVLIVGSGNLTQSGFMTNAEFFEAIPIDADNPVSIEFLAEVRSFLHGLSGMWKGDSGGKQVVLSTLDAMASSVANLPSGSWDDSPISFLHSFKRDLLSQLDISSPTEELYVATPYFGGSIEGLSLLEKRLQPTKINLFPAIHKGEATDMPIDEVRRLYPGTQLAELKVEKKPDAFAHLKLYGIIDGDETGRMFCTSANCTRAAWTGNNIEAGILRKLPTEQIRSYFTESGVTLPTERMGYPNDIETRHTIHCWANDTGNGMNFGVSEDSSGCLPLRNFQLTVRAGSRRFTYSSESLFESKSAHYLTWDVFEAYTKQRHMTQRLDLTGEDSKGRSVNGSCIIEDLTLLTANSKQRSALRGIHALFDGESVPEMGDIAAVFTAVNDLFESPITREPIASSSSGGGSMAATTSETASTAVWPPRAEIHPGHMHIGGAGSGKLQWFQRILQTVLWVEKPEHKTISRNRVSLSEDEAEEDFDERDEKEKAEEEKRKKTAGEMLLSRAKDSRESLIRGLKKLCPTKDQASNILLLAIAGELFFMAARRKAKELNNDKVFDLQSHDLAKEFIRLLVFTRNQGKNFTPPGGCRYRSERFDPLIEDLVEQLKVRIHPDLTNILLAIAVHWKIAETMPLTEMWPRLINLFCPEEYTISHENVLSCHRVWRHYLSYGENCPTDRNFIDALKDLFPGKEVRLP